ncbi:MAG: hypothetical protein ACJA2G_001719 [Cognaticolwellia sp.]|jgi:hypothetical protein
MMKKTFAILACALFSHIATANVDNDLNFQGFSGLINVPTGDVINYGEFHVGYNNLVDSLGGRFGDAGTAYTKGNVFNFGFSPFPGVEVGMRNIGKEFDGGTDLSANLKYSPTFIPDEWFDLSLGIQDIGGAASSLDASFIALSKNIGDFRFTAGIGKQSGQNQQDVAKRYTGGFFGAEYQPYEWLSVMVENDGLNNSAAIKLKTPVNWLNNQGQFYTTLVAKEDFNDKNDALYFGVGYRGSLFSSDEIGINGVKRKERQLADALDWLFNDENTQKYTPIDIGLSTFKHSDDKILSQLGVIKNRITKQGFENVWIGLEKDTLYLRFENSIFNRNDIDAIGVVLGLLSQMAPESTSNLDITLSKYGVANFRFVADKLQVIRFYKGEIPHFSTQAKMANNQQAGDMLWIGGSKSPYFVPRISVSPVLRNFIGSEMGVYDYSLALRTNFTIGLWQGGEVIVDYDINLYNSEDFKQGNSFYRWQHEDGIKNLFLRQTFKLPFNIYSSVALGRSKEMLWEEYNTLALENTWQSPRGAHKVSVYGAYLDSVDFDNYTKEIFTGEYRYYWEDLDVSLSVEAGQFWRQDQGMKISAEFYFGDTKVGVFAQDTDVQSIGISLSVPLTPRRDMRPSMLQLKGSDKWDYQLLTRSDFEGGNPLAPQRAYRPSYLSHVDSTYLNDDRLSVAYMQANIERLRSAFNKLVR